MPSTKEDIFKSIRLFKTLREAVLHDDTAAFSHNLERFITFCDSDHLARKVLASTKETPPDELEQWWSAATQYGNPKLVFPPDSNDEFALRFGLLKTALVEQHRNRVMSLGVAHNQKKMDGWIELFRTLILKPFADELTHRLGDAADLATPEARELQAVPLNRIPGASEIKIFLSHKSVDKPLVYRYYHCLKALGFDPWLDESNMAVGSNLEREILRGFQESCAAVFFITESFTDEKYLAAEVDYAIMQKRKKDKKFAIVTLRHSNAAPVPDLLTPYIYTDVANDLDGFQDLIKALPIELGPVRWKASVV